ncbi:MAG TPA: OmpA family protein [Polyangiaceae bacterium]|nr:OmpA family protein [Polyangiaceae bacterium]
MILAWRTCAAAVLASAFGFAEEAVPTKSAQPLVELGVFGGAFFPSKDHAIASRLPREAYESVAPEIGLRAAIVPFSYLGLELEGAAVPAKTESGQGAGLWAGRAHLIGGAPFGRLTPFALAGVGTLGGGSNSNGSDADPALHFGVGAKLALDDFLGLRVDLRDTLSQKFAASQGAQTHHPEVLLGLTFGIGPESKPPAPPPADVDGDGIPDASDKCPDKASMEPDGCPIADSDGDGVIDRKDACPQEKGTSQCGCPFHDADGDKVIDELDKCPAVAGTIGGCPDPDPDHDGLVGDADKCPNEAETKNGFEDGDGCPDALPEKIKKFTGVVRGIEFDKGKESIRPVSTPVLDAAASVLKEFPALKIEISGHTDTDGDREKNVELSKKRAESVKAYLVDKGTDASRIQTRGVGPDEPMADNKTAAGRQKNRRIEFKVIDQ